MISTELTLCSVLDEVPTCSGLHMYRSFTQDLWLKLIQTITPAHTLILDTAPISNEHGLTEICHSSEDQPALINEQHHQKQYRWMINYSQVG
jgi:hypothetical protein